jgi:hypothetical protein
MLNNLFASLIFTYDIKILPKYIMEFTMDDDEKEKQENVSWKEYMSTYNYEYADFFEDEEDCVPYYENNVVFANPVCEPCSTETLTLLCSGEQRVFLSKCPKCLTTYKTKINGE